MGTDPHDGFNPSIHHEEGDTPLSARRESLPVTDELWVTQQMLDEATHDVRQLEAERDRLVAALREIVRDSPNSDSWSRSKARSALLPLGEPISALGDDRS